MEAGRVYPDAEVAPAITGAGVADVQVPFVDDLEIGGLEGGAEALLDEPDALLGHGRTWMKGLTSVALQAPAAI